MPLVKVNLVKGRSAEQRAAIGDSIQAALVSMLKVPEADLYQLFTEFDDTNFRHTNGYLGLEYTPQLLVIEITILEGRDDDTKIRLLAEINRNLVAAALVRPDDVFIMITEIGLANLSFGGGLAQRFPAASAG
ncbi:tautomerase family protein [Salinibacterium sp.]|uniref:tautomerase family protein n=1 Tax=Salinibacterium sp. TaxID=1915057 RepID=UPI00286A8A4A|nr:tautomerase family protein [Salinibacterium sp.]